jgi:hypothetical protein
MLLEALLLGEGYRGFGGRRPLLLLGGGLVGLGFPVVVLPGVRDWTFLDHGGRFQVESGYSSRIVELGGFLLQARRQS